ncbi:hypothetical protein BVRB_6g137590 isoform A [Beta vulgaris subsp. vulgaris]|nr:hypothetical protein BVRB_6g137590 isoform A [Beta vulgaris subsp. vulgaris]
MENDEETSSGKVMDEIYANDDEKQRHRPIISGEQLDCVKTLSLSRDSFAFAISPFLRHRCVKTLKVSFEFY